MAIFGTAPGTVGKVMSIPGATTPALISIPGLTGTRVVAVTSVGFSQDANAQFMHTLGERVYVYVFGERMGVVEVNGVTFYRPCEGKGGIGNVIDFYKNNTVSVKATLTSVTVGDVAIRGFLRGVRSTFSDGQNGVLGFSLILSTLPVML